jgi:hypothetical protein
VFEVGRGADTSKSSASGAGCSDTFALLLEWCHETTNTTPQIVKRAAQQIAGLGFYEHGMPSLPPVVTFADFHKLYYRYIYRFLQATTGGAVSHWQRGR